jgi:hypothetical protein
MDVPLIKLTIPALALCLLVVLVAGCGGGSSSSDASGKVSIVADTGPTGAGELASGDASSGTQNQRVPITRKGSPTVVYKVPARSLTDGMHLRAIASVTLTKCAVTDYIPHQRAHTACQGTRKYTYDPVKITSRFRLVGGDSAPDLNGKGQQLGPPKVTTCTTAIHHCSISQDFEVDFDPKEVKHGLDPADVRWIVFEVTATSPKAKGCKSLKASQCNVLAVETQKGQAMYWVQADPDLPETPILPRDEKANVDSLDVLTGHGDKNHVRKVVYSVELGPGEQIASILGRQLEIASLLKIEEHNPQAPDIAGYLVLADSPTSIDGRYLISDSYDPNKTGNDGGNCDAKCEQSRPAVVTALQPCDIAAGRRFVNLVADASRAAAKRGEKVDVADGGYVRVSRGYLPQDSIETPSVLSGCDP